MQKDLMRELAATGLEARAVSISHLDDLQHEYATLKKDGILGEAIKGYINGFRMDQNAHPAMRTILVVASAARIGQAVFNGQGGRLVTFIPPTYMEFGSEPKKMESQINQILHPFGHSASLADLPAKLLAARSGLAKYGRNNVCYVKGLGSFVLLTTFVTDMPCEQDDWQPASRMALCASCTACVDNCPTGAIWIDRAVISADRCITLYNEANSSIPFPAWIGPTSHNSLIGCMRCQSVCPVNRDALGRLAEPVEFDRQESDWIRSGKPMLELPESTLAKAKALNMDHYYEPLARNLQALSMASACT